MTSKALPSSRAGHALPGRWRGEGALRLAEGEEVLACLELDLAGNLRFGEGLVAGTDRRLLARSAGETGWQEWPCREGLTLRRLDHAGVGSLELLEDGILL